MVDILDGVIQIPASFDPFKEAEADDILSGGGGGGGGTIDNVHIRVQQRNGKKCVTTVQGLKTVHSYDKILKALKKQYCCNGNIVQDKELGRVIQLQGDQRKNVSTFLIQNGVVKKDQIKLHGF